MVKVIVALVVLCGVARADDAFNMFGFRMSAGALPIDGGDTLTISLGLGVEHPVFKKTRVFGEYEWMWLRERDPTMPERHGNGHRASVGLRRELVGVGKRQLRLYVDAELGGGLALTNDEMAGFALVPAGFVGLRTGYDLYSRADDSPSRTFELELLLRAIAIRDGAGMLIGVGMLWGN